jgi:hypothetical protein
VTNTIKKIIRFFGLSISLVCLQAIDNLRKISLLNEGWIFMQKDVKKGKHEDQHGNAWAKSATKA